MGKKIIGVSGIEEEYKTRIPADVIGSLNLDENDNLIYQINEDGCIEIKKS